MRSLINGQVKSDEWVFGEPGTADDGKLGSGAVRWLVDWLELKEDHRNLVTALVIAPDDDIEAAIQRAGPAIFASELIIVHFDSFTDGRGYTTARLLRRSGYCGDLRVAGDYGRDQMFYLSRCGFSSFGLQSHHDPDDLLCGLDDFTLAYQSAPDSCVDALQLHVG